jgi:hypothetical protein
LRSLLLQNPIPNPKNPISEAIHPNQEARGNENPAEKKVVERAEMIALTLSLNLHAPIAPKAVAMLVVGLDVKTPNGNEVMPEGAREEALSAVKIEVGGKVAIAETIGVDHRRDLGLRLRRIPIGFA